MQRLCIGSGYMSVKSYVFNNLMIFMSTKLLGMKYLSIAGLIASKTGYDCLSEVGIIGMKGVISMRNSEITWLRVGIGHIDFQRGAIRASVPE
jgi:hypothetical protein